MTVPILHEFPPTRSNRVKWALEELGIKYAREIVDFQNGDQQSPEHRKVHPLGHVPAYSTDQFVMHESVAILLQLLDEHPEAGLAPLPASSARATYHQCCVFACAEMDSYLFDVMKHTMHLPQEARNVGIAERGLERFDRRAEHLSSALANQAYLLDDRFSGADIAIGYDCNWAAYLGLLDRIPVLNSYYGRLQERPAFQTEFAG
jgi:glutathione S-transferase